MSSRWCFILTARGGEGEKRREEKRILPRWLDEERFIESRGREIERPPSWRDGWTERERERRGGETRGGRLTRCVWAVSLRHQLDGRSKECARVAVNVYACVCVCAPRAVCTDVDRPLCSIGAGGLAKMAVSEARRGEVK